MAFKIVPCINLGKIFVFLPTAGETSKRHCPRHVKWYKTAPRGQADISFIYGRQVRYLLCFLTIDNIRHKSLYFSQ